MFDELERIWKQMVVVKSGYNTNNCLKALKKTTRSLRYKAGVPSEIRTDHLPLGQSARCDVRALTSMIVKTSLQCGTKLLT
jgi:hypothetical protein